MRNPIAPSRRANIAGEDVVEDIVAVAVAVADVVDYVDIDSYNPLVRPIHHNHTTALAIDAVVAVALFHLVVVAVTSVYGVFSTAVSPLISLVFAARFWATKV